MKKRNILASFLQTLVLRGGFWSRGLVLTQTVEITHINEIIQGVGQVKTGLSILRLCVVEVFILHLRLLGHNNCDCHRV